MSKSMPGHAPDCCCIACACRSGYFDEAIDTHQASPKSYADGIAEVERLEAIIKEKSVWIAVTLTYRDAIRKVTKIIKWLKDPE